MIQAWLNILSQSIPGTRQAIVLNPALAEDNVVASWPAGNAYNEELLGPARLVTPNKPLLVSQGRSDTGETLLHIARQIESKSPRAENLILSIELAADISQQQRYINLLQWAEQWLMLTETSHKTDVNLQLLEDLVALTGNKDPGTSLQQCTDTIAGLFDIDCLLVGLEKDGQFEVTCVSQLADFDRKAALIQDAEKLFNQPGENLSVEGRTRIQQAYGFEQIERIEFPAGRALLCNAHSVSQLETTRPGLQSLFNLLGLCLSAEHQSERKATANTSTLTGLLKRYRVAAVALGLILLSAFIETDDTVSSSAVLEGKVQRAIVAPYDGFIADQFSRAGDQVQQGDTVATLDATEFQHERRLWLANKAEAEKQYRQALGEVRQAEAQIFAAKIEQAEAHLDIIERKLKQSNLLAPISGIIIKGDLSRALDAPVSRGEILFEMAPVDEYRLATFVAEDQITQLAIGQEGIVVFDALPDQSVPFRISRIALATEQADGNIKFRVEANIDDEYLRLARPGMTGIARITTGRASLLWTYVKPIVGWTQLQIWKWLP